MLNSSKNDKASGSEEAVDTHAKTLPPACDQASSDMARPMINIPEFTNLPISPDQIPTTKVTSFKTVILRRKLQRMNGTPCNEVLENGTRDTDIKPAVVESLSSATESSENDELSGIVKFPSVSGAILTEYATVADVFKPQIYSKQPISQMSRRYKGLSLLRQNPGFECLKVIRVWKGLSWEAAESLLFWEQIFARVLLCWLEGNIGDIDQHWGTSRYIPVCLDKIMDGMLILSRETARSARPDVFSVGTCRKTLSQFIRTHECFTLENCGRDNSAGRLVVGVKIWKPDHRDAPPAEPIKTTAEIIWNMNYISFADFDHDVLEGNEFRLVPKFVSVANAKNPHYYIKYSTPATWLHWCHEFGGFIGVVPFYSDPKERLLHPNPTIVRKAPMSSDNFYILQFIITATVTEIFEGGVRLEQTASARISLRITTNPPPPATGSHGGASANEEEKLPWPKNRELAFPGISMEEYEDYKNQVNYMISQVSYPMSFGFNSAYGPPNMPLRDDMVTPDSPLFVHVPINEKEYDDDVTPKSLYRQFMSWKSK